AAAHTDNTIPSARTDATTGKPPNPTPRSVASSRRRASTAAYRPLAGTNGRRRQYRSNEVADEVQESAQLRHTLLAGRGLGVNICLSAGSLATLSRNLSKAAGELITTTICSNEVRPSAPSNVSASAIRS